MRGRRIPGRDEREAPMKVKFDFTLDDLVDAVRNL